MIRLYIFLTSLTIIYISAIGLDESESCTLFIFTGAGKDHFIFIFLISESVFLVIVRVETDRVGIIFRCSDLEAGIIFGTSTTVNCVNSHFAIRVTNEFVAAVVDNLEGHIS